MSNDELKLPDPDGGGSVPLTWADIKAIKTARRAEHEMLLDTSLRQVEAEARAELRAARRAQVMMGDDASKANKAKASKAVKAAEQAVADAEAALVRATITWKLKAIGQKALDDLIEQWPATPQQQLKHRKIQREAGEPPTLLSFNDQQFKPRLIAACLEEPEMSEAEVLEMWADPAWSDGELGVLYNIAWMLCQTPN